jgi:SAM-dependent methyltransferase
MHTKISPDNPYRYGRWCFAWEHVPAGTGSHLDFGCSRGEFLNKLRDRQIGRLVSVDVSEEAVNQGHKLFPELEIIKIPESPNLPFDDAAFDSVTFLDVLEHVYEQAELLAEVNRVLKDGGKLIVTVPGRHFFLFWVWVISSFDSQDYIVGIIVLGTHAKTMNSVTCLIRTV